MSFYVAFEGTLNAKWITAINACQRFGAFVSDHFSGLFERLSGKAQSAAGQLHVKSALNPLLWLCAIISLPCFGMAWVANGMEPLATMLVYVGVAPVGVTCLLAVFFAVFRPDKLQSEDYQIRHEAMELIREKGSTIDVSPSSLHVITNPIHRSGADESGR